MLVTDHSITVNSNKRYLPLGAEENIVIHPFFFNNCSHFLLYHIDRIRHLYLFLNQIRLYLIRQWMVIPIHFLVLVRGLQNIIIFNESIKVKWRFLFRLLLIAWVLRFRLRWSLWRRDRRLNWWNLHLVVFLRILRYTRRQLMLELN